MSIYGLATTDEDLKLFNSYTYPKKRYMIKVKGIKYYLWAESKEEAENLVRSTIKDIEKFYLTRGMLKKIHAEAEYKRKSN